MGIIKNTLDRIPKRSKKDTVDVKLAPLPKQEKEKADNQLIESKNRTLISQYKGNINNLSPWERILDVLSELSIKLPVHLLVVFLHLNLGLPLVKLFLEQCHDAWSSIFHGLVDDLVGKEHDRCWLHSQHVAVRCERRETHLINKPSLRLIIFADMGDREPLHGLDHIKR